MENKFAIRCPVCREAENIVPFEQRLDVDNRLIDLVLCKSCFAVINATDLHHAMHGDDNEPKQALSSDQFYAIDQQFLIRFNEIVKSNRMIQFLIEHVPDIARGTVLDFGAGQGINSASAAVYFKKVFAVDLSLTVLSVVHEWMENRYKIHITSDLQSIQEPLDLVLSMHVLEHLPNMRDFLDGWVDNLNPGGAIFFQVPMLKRDHIVSVHYTFFNEACVRTLAEQVGLDVVGVWFDPANDFLTSILRKPLALAA